MSKTGPGQAKVCRVCRRVLALFEDGEGTQEWVHGLQDETLDHAPVPVDQSEVKALTRCDFCNEDDTASYVLPVADFALPGLDRNMAGDDWAACRECARRIETNQWTSLFKRAVTCWERQHKGKMPPEVKAALGELHRKVRKNVRGPLYLYTPPEAPEEPQDVLGVTEWGQNRPGGLGA